jgi:hypothetical protein
VATQSANKKRRVHIAPGTDVTSSSSNTPGISISPQNTLSVAKADTSQQILSQIRPVSSYTYTPTPPLASELLATIESHGLPRRVYRAPWYSDPEDAPETAREYAGLVYHLKGGEGLDTLANWQIHPDLTALDSYSQPAWLPCNGWEYNGQPPSNREARRWLQRFYDKNPTKIINKHLWHSQVCPHACTDLRGDSRTLDTWSDRTSPPYPKISPFTRWTCRHSAEAEHDHTCAGGVRLVLSSACYLSR